MYLGMHYIDGLFLPNRPDVQRASGLFPIANEEEINNTITSVSTAIDQLNRFSSLLERRLGLKELLMLFYSNYDVITQSIAAESTVYGRDYIDYMFNQLLVKIGNSLVDDARYPNFFVSATLLVTGWDFDVDFGIWHLYWHLLVGSPVIWIPNSQSCASSQIIVDLINQTNFRNMPGSLTLLHGNKNTVKEVLKSDRVSHFICGTKNIFTAENI